MEAKRTFKSKKPLPVRKKMGELTKLSHEDSLQAHQDAMAQGARCTECPLFGLRSGPVMGEVLPHAPLVIIGQEPGASEVEQKQPLIGEAGRVVDECLAEAGVAREEVSVTNAILCRPPEDFDAFAARQKLDYRMRVVKLREEWEAAKVEWLRRKKAGDDIGTESYPKFTPPPPPATPQECCAPRLKRELDVSRSPVIMPLGAMAVEAVATYYDVPFGASRKTLPGESRLNSLKKQAGSPATMPDGTIVVASYHPGFGTRKGSRHYMHVIREHITRGARISKRGHYDWQEPHYIINPRVDTIKDVLARFQAVHARVTVDIETDKGSSVSGKFDPFTCRIRCIGLGAKVDDNEVIICVPLRHISGAEWWSTREEKMEVLRALVSFFNDPDIQLVGHNFAFDSSVLLRYNIMRDRRRLYQDTMLMHHDIIDCDLPHDLGFVAARYFEVPSWKGAADDKYYTEVTDHDLQLYNCLMKGTTVVMADGRHEPIETLVRSRSQEKVLSMSLDGRIEARAIVDWHTRKVPGQEWVFLRTSALSKTAKGLVLTPDHEVYTPRGRLRADQLKVDDEVYTSEEKWSEEQRCAILGTLLGDSSLKVSPVFRERIYEAKTAYMEGCHTKSSMLTSFKVQALSPYLRHDGIKAGGERIIKGATCVAEDSEKYRSKNLRQFKELLPLIYDEDGRRRLRLAALESLGPIGLAWWYMDDGCRQNGAKAPQWTGAKGGKEYNDDSMCFAANRYPREDIDLAVDWFRRNYGNTTAGKDKIIRLGIVASRKLSQEIAPYICETLRYKLPRQAQYPAHTAIAPSTGQPATERITEIGPYTPARETRSDRYLADTSYCITVEGNHNFFTSVGLVKNCRDVLTTMRLDEVLTKEIYKYATTEQYDMDRRLAPIARDMGELGLFVDEVKRGELSKTMNAEAWARYTRLKEITGDPNFNANASRHIQNFLFRVKKLQPEFNSKGEAFQDGEDPSTNANALLALGTKQKLDDETRDFINNLFEYRAYKKLTGTYIDNLQVQYPDWSKHGYAVPLVAPVTGRIYHKFTKTEMRAHHAETGTWSDGRWDETIVIPERPGLSRLYTTYKLHVIPSGRMSTQPACFDGETEILTRRGWLRFADLLADDEVAQYHWDDGAIEFVKPTAHIAYHYEGEMVRVEGKNLDVLCTPDHRFRFRTRAKRNTVEVEARDWPVSSDMKVPVAGSLQPQSATSEALSEAELRFLLAAQADGYVNSGGYWEFSFTKSRKVEALAGTLAALGYKHTVAPKKNGPYIQTRFVVQDPRTSWIDAYLRREGVEKTFVAEKVLSLPVANLTFIADEVMMWDGCATRMNHYSSSNKANADLIQAVHVLVGRTAKVRRYENPRLTKPNWQVDVRARVEALNCAEQSRVPYSGMVYCVSVPSSMIVVRRNNKPLVAGNCQNWPERGKANMRDMIVAPPGHVIVGADLDQVELRLYASISGDRLLLKAFNTPGMDPHAYNAASLFAKTWGKSLEDAYQHIVTMPDQEEAKAKAMLRADPDCYKQMGYASVEAMLASAHKKGEQNKKKHRNIAKTFVYLETYGGEAEKLYMYMSMARDKATGELMFPGLREEQVHEWHNEWHKHHPETKSWQRTCAQVARVEGYTASPFGCFRKRFYPGGPNKHAAVFNHIIQASAAEVANSALLKIAQQIPYGSWSPFTGPCLQVHDYIGVYVPVERAEEAKRIVEEAMCTTVFGIAITASAKVSERWSQQ